MSSGKSSRTSTTETTSTPWSGVSSQMEDVNKKAQAAYEAMNKDPYAGDLTASQNTYQDQARNLTLDNANANLGMGNSTIQLGQDTISGKYLDPNSNPFFASTVNAALRPIQDNFANNTVRQIGSKAISGGAYGGARNGIALAQAAQDMARQTADTSAQMWNANYQNERARQMQGGNLVTQGYQINQMPVSSIEAVGNQLFNIDQQAINDAITKFNAEQMSPWTGLSEYAGLLQGTSGYGTQMQTSIAPKSGNSTLNALLGLGMTAGGFMLGGPTGAMLGSSLSSGLSSSPMPTYYGGAYGNGFSPTSTGYINWL